jgi:hypothetical protein
VDDQRGHAGPGQPGIVFSHLRGGSTCGVWACSAVTETESDVGAEPAIDPGARRARPVIAALYGELQLHPWWSDPHIDSPPFDLYGLFYARASAMGWLTEATEGAPKGGFWGMNEGEHDASPGPHWIAWCQVDLTNPDAAGRIPLQPVLTCLGDAVTRIGTPQISAIQIALPALEPGPSSSDSALRALTFNDASWFLSSDSRSRTGIRATLDGGTSPQIHAAAQGMLEWMTKEPGVASFESLLPPDNALDPLDRSFGGDTWPGPPQHRVTMRGTLVEWSLDALGWLATLAAAAASHHGVSTSWMLTVKRVDTSGDKPPAAPRWS